MSKPSVPVTVHILEKEYRVACKENEQDDLHASAEYLNKKLREIRDAGKVIGAERMAVMAALNIAHELLRGGGAEGADPDRSLAPRIRALQDKIELALNKGQQLEL